MKNLPQSLGVASIPEVSTKSGGNLFPKPNLGMLKMQQQQ
jgi:hypothetical protein